MVMQGEFEFEASFRLHSKFQAATLGSQNLVFKKKKKKSKYSKHYLPALSDVSV